MVMVAVGTQFQTATVTGVEFITLSQSQKILINDDQAMIKASLLRRAEDSTLQCNRFAFLSKKLVF